MSINSLSPGVLARLTLLLGTLFFLAFALRHITHVFGVAVNCMFLALAVDHVTVILGCPNCL